MALITQEEALNYHSQVRPGKIEVVPVKPCRTQKDLSLAYSPGVAEACMAIHADKEASYTYTGRGNLVAVVSNGTAVLGLGNIGPEAAKPVMEGKGVLFKVFADVDCYDLNLNVSDPEKLCEIVKALEPTFGGINLEDIKAPECFHIEDKLKKEMDIPVFHDDQHGTAIISGAALINSLDISGKSIGNLRLVINGAGAAAVACARFYQNLGVNPEQIAMFDTKGHIHKGRTDLNQEKREFATSKKFASLEEAMQGADCFLGLSVAGAVSRQMIKGMAKNPLIFACANPDPEIPYSVAVEERPDCIMATGRSDFPNQINNVIGFPFIFRGALDVHARSITEGMKVAAANAIAVLAREDIPDYIATAYNTKSFSYGRDYIIPKALDLRLIERVSPAVAKSAMEEGVARKNISLAEYPKQLAERLQASRVRMENVLQGYRL